MSRELKVKAWDKLNEEWIHIKSLNLWDDEGLWYMEDFDGEVYFSTDNKWTLVRYTGLKDKNGVEIYEGDILYHKLQGKRKVYYPFDNRVASFGLEQMDNGMKSTLQDANRVYEVIGNIYENPELLDKQQ